MAVEIVKQTLELKMTITGVEFEALPTKIKKFYQCEYQDYASSERDRYRLDIAATGLTLTEACEVFKAEQERVEGAAVKLKVVGNTWRTGPGFNLTEQGQILKHDPALATRLQREAQAG